MVRWSRRAVGIVFASMLVMALVRPANAGLNSVSLFVTTVYDQTSASPPTTPFGHFISMGGSFQTNGEFNAGTATFTGGSRALGVAGTRLTYTSGYYSSLANLHAAFPLSVYTITARNTITSAQQSAAINYLSDDFTTAIPAAAPATYTALAGMNPAGPFAFNYNAHTAHPNNDEAFTVLTIFLGSSTGIVYSSPFLPASQTSHVIPANTLLPNTLYRYDIIFTDRDTGSSNGVTTFRGLDVRTNGFFVTGAVPEPAALMWMAALLLAGRRPRRGDC